MHRLLKIFTFWLLSLAAFCSCSKGPEMTEGGIIVISGTISDMDTKQPLEGVKILFTAYDSDEDFTLPVTEQNVYTDSKGSYSIMASGFSTPVTCVIVTEAEGYAAVRKEVFVNWEGTSFDRVSNSFFVNECDFHLEKK